MGSERQGAARFAENALDLAHLDFVHPGLLGSPGDTVIEPYDVEIEDGVVYHALHQAVRWSGDVRRRR